MKLEYKSTWLRQAERDNLKAYCVSNRLRMSDVVSQAVKEYLERVDWTPPGTSNITYLGNLPDSAARSSDCDRP